MRIAIEHLVMPAAGQRVSGDVVVVRREPRRTLIAVIDALGHGPQAAATADLAADELRSVELDGGLAPIVDRVHQRLHGSRGAAATLCLLDGGRIQGCAVGNVELRFGHSNFPIIMTPGILGSNLRRLRLFDGALAAVDRMLMFSDGVSSRVRVDETSGLTPLEACKRILMQHRRTHDDATILVADLEGE